MEKLHPLTEWLIKRIKTEYKEDIALLIGIKGHATNEDSHGECFDYFVPATDRGNELSETFIIDGVGYDLYPRTWERLENSVQLEDMALLIDKATILYARSKEDEECFQSLKKRLHENLNNPEFVYGKALEYMDKALEIYRSLIFEEKNYRARSEANYIHLYLSKAIAVLNNTYTEAAIYSECQAYNDMAESRMYHCPEMKIVPDGFFDYARRLLEAQDVHSLCEIIFSLLKTTRSFILERKPTVECQTVTKVNYDGLADWYQELSLTWRRIRFFCENNMVEQAYTDACYLQQELMYISQEYQVEELNLLDFFASDDLSLLAERSNLLEGIIKDILEEHQVSINSYESLEDFLKKRS